MQAVQSYNSGNNLWVKRDVETGKILANSREKFPGVPVKGQKKSSDSHETQSSESLNSEQNEGPDKEVAPKEDDSDSWGFFDFG